MDAVHPDEDLRGVDELLNAALMSDEDARWDIIWVLHRRGSMEVFRWAERLCRSDCPIERCLGVDVLAQLGVPDRTFPEQSLRILSQMCQTEIDLDVLYAVLLALGHLHDRRTVPLVAMHASHPDEDIRFGVVQANLSQDDTFSLQLLIRLSRDSSPKVRDWATFGLGTLSDNDTPEIREALSERLSDVDDMTRSEAIVGLARRGDRRVIPALQAAFAARNVGTLDLEAARDIAANELVPNLVTLRGWWDVDVDLLEQAILACSNSGQ